MTKQELLNELEELLEINRGSLTVGDPLESIKNWDSLAVVTYITMADEHFDLKLNPKKISQAETISDLFALIGDRFSSPDKLCDTDEPDYL